MAELLRVGENNSDVNRPGALLFISKSSKSNSDGSGFALWAPLPSVWAPLLLRLLVDENQAPE